MTVLELNAKKAELIKTILNEVDSEDVLNKVGDLVKKLTSSSENYPCMYSDEEIQAGADRVLDAWNNGDGSRFISFEDVKAQRAHYGQV